MTVRQVTDSPETRVVRSADGTAIEYLTMGDGPPVIMIHGAPATAVGLLPLARLLAGRHTVHVMQRRGRGGSGPQGDRYGIERECEDLEAVRVATGARFLFGHSFGGLVALRAACVTGAPGSAEFDAVAVYEPGVSVGGSIPLGWTGRARAEVLAGADLDAFLTFVRGVNPDQAGRVPRWLLRIVLRLVISRAELRERLALMPQTISEHVEERRLASRFGDYEKIGAATLIMRGEGRHLNRQAIALAELADTIPNAEVMAFPGLGHLAPEKQPAGIAAPLLRFFAAHV